MNDQQWRAFEAAVKGESDAFLPALIVDSPWMPGYCGVSSIDFFAQPDVWFDCYRKLKRDFPGLLLLPDWWVEYGMATEAASFGCKIDFFAETPPVVHHIYETIDDLAEAGAPAVPNLLKSGLTPLALSVQRGMQPKIQALGEDYKIVCARGPFTIASHLLPLTELLVGVKVEPEAIRALLCVTTQVCKQWLTLQLDNVKNAKGVLVLDDVCGFLSHDDFAEFAEPCFAEIFNAFPGLLHLFHNDTDNDVCYSFLDRIGVDAVNPTYLKDVAHIRTLLGNRVAIIGNIPPMSLAQDSPEAVRQFTTQNLRAYVEKTGGTRGLIPSAGGGAPMGARGENIRAFVSAASGFSRN